MNGRSKRELKLTRQIVVRLEPKVADCLERKAAREGWTVAQQVRVALEEHFGWRERPDG